MTDDKLRAALATAYHDAICIPDGLTFGHAGGDTDAVCTIDAGRLAAALVASAPDEGPGPYNYSDGFNDAVAARPAAPPAPDEGPRYVTHDEVEAVLNAMPGGRPPGIIVGPDAASAPDEGRDVERLEDAFSRAGALLHEEVWHIRTDELPAILAALAASATDEGPPPTPADLRGLARGMTGGLSSEEYVRSIRDAHPAAPALDEGHEHRPKEPTDDR